MNAEQIRAEMAEVIARDLVRAESGNIDPADRHYNMAESALDALAAAGLLPTAMERRAIDGGEPWTHADGGRSVLPVYGSECRYVTEWRAVSE